MSIITENDNNIGNGSTEMYESFPKYYMGITAKEEVRAKSSSGGIFYELAKKTLNEGGIVFGAYYDNNTQLVYHASTEEVSLEKLMRSKYVESNIGDTYARVLEYLENGRKVLFAGTPCQAAGMRQLASLKAKDKLANLLIVDFLCEGVPSKLIFLDYQKMHEKRYGSRVKDVIFRSKAYGWVPHAMKVVFENGKEYVAPYFNDVYMHTFIKDLVFNRPSCYYCHFRQKKYSDITLGDFWNVSKLNAKLDDNKGYSVIFTNSEYGDKVINSISSEMKCEFVDGEERSCMEQSLDLVPFKNIRDDFYAYYHENGFEKSVKKYSSYAKNANLKKRVNYFKYWVKLEMKRRFK